VLARGDEHHELCDAAARTLYFAVTSSTAVGAVEGGGAVDAELSAALSGLTLVHALHPTVLVDDGVSITNGLKLLSGTAPALKAKGQLPLTWAAYLLARAATAPLSSTDAEIVSLLSSSLDDESYEVVAAAVEAISVYTEGHPGAFATDVATHLLRVSSKEAGGAETKRNLLQAVRTLEAYLANPSVSIPSETVHFRARDAVVTGFKRILLLQEVRSFVKDGLQAHFAHNPAVRRLFNLTEDLTLKLSKEDKTAEVEAKRQAQECKEESQKDRSNARKQKHAARSGVADDDDE
jgi:hypothetical protein